MAYIINNTRGNVVAVVDDGTVDTTSTDIKLIGRAVTDYGTEQNENFVQLMENFADSTEPGAPLQGQLWYNTGEDTMYVRSTLNEWVAQADQDYVQAQKVSPAFTGVPTAPTATTNTNSTQIATTAFVQAQKVSPTFTGTPLAPTAPIGTGTPQIATCAFVVNEINNISYDTLAPKASPALTGVPTAPTASAGDNTTQIATTAFVTTAVQNVDLTLYAPKASPALTGTPTAPTPGASNDSNVIATTSFVQAQKASPAFTGVPTAPTAPVSTSNTQIATTQFVLNQLGQIDFDSFATKASPTFTGVPTAPTASAGTGNTQIATTAFVGQAIASIPQVTATTERLGVVQVGSGLNVDGNGVISATNTSTGNVSSISVVSGGAGISISGSPVTSSGTITVTNSGVTSIVAGDNIDVSGSTGAVTISADLSAAGAAAFSSFAQSGTGYLRFSNGFTIQWGTGTTGSSPTGEATVTFPTAFTTACWSVAAIELNSLGWGVSGPNVEPTVYGTKTAPTTTGCTIRGARMKNGSNNVLESGLSFQWIAVGK